MGKLHEDSWEKLRYLYLGQACFYIGMAICMIIRPGGLTVNDGVSYYGTYRATIIPYTLALLGPAYYTLKLAHRFDDKSLAVVRYALSAIALLMVGILLTPYTINNFVGHLHQAIGSLLFILELLLSLWLIVKLGWNRLAILFTVVEFASGVASLIWLHPKVGFLLEAQLVFQAGFGAVLIYCLPLLNKTGSVRNDI